MDKLNKRIKNTLIKLGKGVGIDVTLFNREYCRKNNIYIMCKTHDINDGWEFVDEPIYDINYDFASDVYDYLNIDCIDNVKFYIGNEYNGALTDSVSIK